MKTRTTKLLRPAFEDLLKKCGYVRIGQGGYSNVYAKPGDKRVVKVGFVCTDHYIHYAHVVGIRNRNKHLPKIHSIRVYDVDPANPMSMPYYVVVMERLVDKFELAYEFYNNTLRMDRDNMPKPLRLANQLIDRVCKEFVATRDMTQGRNVMYRRLTPVYTDPVV